jgi:orotate phosphoribosyltransferase
MVAQELGCEFAYAGRLAPTTPTGLYQVEYRVPASLHAAVKGRRVAIVNDFINAGSAVRGAHQDLLAIGAHVLAVGTLVLLGDSYRAFVNERGLALEALAEMPNDLWTPAECPLCRQGIQLESPAVA